MAIWGPPVKNLTPSFAPPTSISHKTDVFPLPSDVHGIYLTFLCYYVAWPCDLDLWRFDSWQCFIYSASNALPTNQFRLAYYYRLLSFELQNSIIYLLSGTVTTHAPCHVIYTWVGGKWSTFKKSLIFKMWTMWTWSLIHFITFKAKIKPCLWRKGYKVHSECIGVPKTTRNNFFGPELSIP